MITQVNYILFTIIDCPLDLRINQIKPVIRSLESTDLKETKSTTPLKNNNVNFIYATQV